MICFMAIRLRRVYSVDALLRLPCAEVGQGQLGQKLIHGFGLGSDLRKGHFDIWFPTGKLGILNEVLGKNVLGKI